MIPLGAEADGFNMLTPYFIYYSLRKIRVTVNNWIHHCCSAMACLWFTESATVDHFHSTC